MIVKCVGEVTFEVSDIQVKQPGASAPLQPGRYVMLGGEYEALQAELKGLREERARVFEVLSSYRAAYVGHTLLDSVVGLVNDRDRLKLEVEALRGEADGVTLSRPIGVLKLGGPVAGRLRGLKIQTVGDLMKRTREDLLRVKRIGPSTLNAIEQALAREGLSLDREAL